MKSIRFGLMALCFTIMSACSVPGYLPKFDELNVHTKGSYIRVYQHQKNFTGGELIALDSKFIYILSEKTNKCISVERQNVYKYSLWYAKPKAYWWTIPTAIILPAIHGIYSLFTFPVHLITTIAVSGSAAFRYHDKNLNYTDLKMFARFPQGLPTGMSLEDIK